MANIERRFNNVAPELREPETGGKPTIVGYASVFNKRSAKLAPGFIERVDNRAFDASGQAGFPGVVARFDHDPQFLLGTVAGKTLQVWTDDTGLAYSVLPPDSRADIVELMERGDVTSSSFQFRAAEDDWDRTEFGYPLRTLLSVELMDVSPVVTPAYPDSTSQLRAFDGAVESLARKFSASPEEIRGLMDNGKLPKLFKLTTPKGSTKPDEGILAKYRQLKSELDGKKFDPYIGDDSSSTTSTAPKLDTATREGRMRSLEYMNSRKTGADAYCPDGSNVKHLGGNDGDASSHYTGISMSGKTADEYEAKHASSVKRLGGAE